MTYGNKLLCLFTILSLLFIVGCENKFLNFHLDLYDGYSIKGIDNTVKLYKNDEVVKIENDDYRITEFKYNKFYSCSSNYSLMQYLKLITSLFNRCSSFPNFLKRISLSNSWLSFSRVISCSIDDLF